MSIFGSLRSGVSGLYTFGQAMGMISDNIANSNSVGYKRASARFSNFVINQDDQSFYAPGGARVRNVREIGEQGLLVRSQATTDVAVSGRGFFVVTDRVSRNPDTGEWVNSGQIHYTRSGQFRPDRNGNLRNAEGFYLLGWPPDDTRSQNELIPTFKETNRVDLLQAVNVALADFSPIATTQVDLGVNLNKGQEVLASVPPGNIPTYPPGTYHFEVSTPIITHSGEQDTLTLRYVKVGEYSWQVHAVSDKSSLVENAEIDDDRAFTTYGTVRTTDPKGQGPTDAATFLIGTITFDAHGNLVTVEGEAGNVQVRRPLAGGANLLQASDGVLTLFLDPDGADTNFATPDPATPDDRLAIDIDFGVIDQSVGHSHFEQRVSFTKTLDQNGRAFSFLNGVSFGDNGELSATFANGESRIISKTPVATFTNPNGLRARTGNVFLETISSGQVLLREGGTGGAGVTVGSSLEQSATDLANEFSEMIIVQRAYAANTRIVSTADQMLDELLRAKR